MSVTIIIPWKKTVSDTQVETIKWTHVNARYEIHAQVLENLELSSLLPHCLEIKAKIESVVTTAAHIGPSLFRVFPRTISMVLRSIWDIIVEDDQPNETIDDFDATIRTFIASHATPEDRHELVQQLRSPRKPREMLVQSFYYRLREINGYVEWLPGAEDSLNEDQLKQAFYDSMPPTWRERFVQAGHSSSAMTLAQVLRYFRQQESLAARKQAENDRLQQRTKTTNRRNNNTKTPFKRGVDKKTKTSKYEPAVKKQRISDDTPCPIHPGLPHLWGGCWSNKYRKQNDQQTTDDKSDGKKKEFKKPASTKTSDHFAVNLSPDKEKTDDEISINDTIMNEDVDLEGKSSAAKTASSKTISSFALTDTFVSFDLQNETDSLTVATCYMQYITNLFVSGDDLSENGLIDNNNDVSTSLSLRPIGLLVAKRIQNLKSDRPLKTLFDPGSDRTFINRRVLPIGANGKTVESIGVNTINGVDKVNQKVILEELTLPEFSATRKIDQKVSAYIFDQESSPYDIVIGLDLLVPLGIDISCSTKTISWQDEQVTWKPKSYFLDSNLNDSVSYETHCFFINSTDDFDEWIESHSTTSVTIKSSKYESIDTDEVARQQKHLSKSQQDDLAKVLHEYTLLFNGKLGHYPGYKVHLELLENAQPFHYRPYPIPTNNAAVFKEELERLVQIGVLSRTGPSEYLSPTFIVPKKDGRVRFVSDFRALNKIIKRKVYTLPRIQDILKKRSGYKFFTKLDISMQYYTFELDEASKNLCTICTPFGNYRYNRLPMGVKQSSDVAQEIMENLFRDLDEVDVYMDDVGCFSNSWEEHLQSLHKVLTILQSSNFTVNPLKCEWAVQETDWLGYWLTPTGLKPWRKKIDAILKMQAPQTMKQLRSFIGAVTFYRDMFPRRSHLLAPLTDQVGKKILNWTPQCQKTFDTIKALLAGDAFIKYPDHNRPFHVYCDASDLQLGAVIMQDNAPVAYYSRKLNSAQKNYTVGEKELLSIIETLKEYHSMLYGSKELHIYTDHKNITFSRLNTQRVLRWRLFLEEYNPIIHYIKGESNTLADALSRLPFSERQNQDKYMKNPNDQYKYHDSSLNDSSFYSMAIDDDDLFDCFVHLPDQAGIPFVLDYETIADAQTRDAELQQLAQQEPTKYIRQLLAPNIHVWCYINEPNAPWKIFIPNELFEPAIRWYHLALGHIGSSRLWDTMKMHFYNRHLKNRIEDIVSRCDTCQRLKLTGRGHGEVAAREAALLPWREIAVDLIGPWTLRIGGQENTFIALTMIDMVTNLVEVVRLDNKTSAHVALHFENTWLSRYPRPIHVIYDQGGEFTGYPFQNLLQRHHIHRHPISSKNPQANSVCERMHQTIGNSLRVLSTLNPPAGLQDALQLVDTAIANAVFATRATFHSSIQTTPGGLAFGRDMVLDIPLVADLQLIQERRQQLIDDRLIVANRRRFSYDYNVGDEVLKLIYKPDKLETRTTGPYRVERVHANGTLTIRLSPTTIERISLRRIKPYRR
jgi:transposase InsO family protein